MIKSFLKFLTESKEKHIVVAMARMSPPTMGHEKAVEKIKKYAESNNADHMLYISHSHDAKKNPLHPDTKMKHLKRAFPDTNMKMTSPNKGIVDHIAGLHEKGYTHVTMIAGQDRVGDYNKLFDRVNADKKFKSMKVVSAGNRSENSSDKSESISGTKMRKFVEKNDYPSFHANLPSRIASDDGHSKELWNDLRKPKKD